MVLLLFSFLLAAASQTHPVNLSSLPCLCDVAVWLALSTGQVTSSSTYFAMLARPFTFLCFRDCSIPVGYLIAFTVALVPNLCIASTFPLSSAFLSFTSCLLQTLVPDALLPAHLVLYNLCWTCWWQLWGFYFASVFSCVQTPLLSVHGRFPTSPTSSYTLLPMQTRLGLLVLCQFSFFLASLLLLLVHLWRMYVAGYAHALLAHLASFLIASGSFGWMLK